MFRLLYRQLLRNVRTLGWDGRRGVPLSLMDTGERPLYEMAQVKYHWDLEWGEGFSEGWVWCDTERPELHSLVYEVKNGILFDDENYSDIIFKVVKQTGEWAAKKKKMESIVGGDIEFRADGAELNSTQIVYQPFEELD